MEIELRQASAQPPAVPPHVSRSKVDEALADAQLAEPTLIHPSVALIARHAKSRRTAWLRLERLARVVMAADPQINRPEQVWGQNWFALTPGGAHNLDAAIRNTWAAPSTRNAMRDAVRATIREASLAGAITSDQRDTLLNALRIEDLPRDPEKQSRGHLSDDKVKEAFSNLAKDPSPTARRDTALIALLVGAGLRRAEATSLDLTDLDDAHETIVVHGKGNTVRSVPLAPGARRALNAWLKLRGEQPGPLFTPMTRTKPREPVLDKRLSTATVAQIVKHRFGTDVAPHDLRRTFTGNLLDSGADLSTTAQVLGHASVDTTAGYDRRAFATRRAAVEKLDVPFVEAASWESDQ